MKYAVEKKGDVVLVLLKSNLEGGPDTFELKDEVKAQLGHGSRRFLLDMKDAGFVNSTGIGVVVSILASIKEHSGLLKVCGVSDRVRRAFVTTGVWALFDSYATQEQALAAFEKS
jgi:anti-sigma B factor antagonist